MLHQGCVVAQPSFFIPPGTITETTIHNRSKMPYHDPEHCIYN